MVQKTFEVSEISGKGRGLIALRPFKFGKLVMRITGDVINDPDYGSMYCIDLGEGRSLEPHPPGAYLNHSCDPNCELVLVGGKTVQLRATKDVGSGCELTIDYAWSAGDDPSLCCCGSQNCRTYIVAADQLRKLALLLQARQARQKSAPPPMAGNSSVAAPRRETGRAASRQN